MRIAFMLQSVLVPILLILVTIFLISPFWFQRRIVPKIEQRVGKKIKYYNPYEKFSISRFGIRESGLALYITLAWLGLNFLKNNHSQALNHVDYKVKEASKEEIIASILYTLSIWASFIIMIVLYFLPKI